MPEAATENTWPSVPATRIRATVVANRVRKAVFFIWFSLNEAVEFAD
jgi:hypothetical protein